MAARIRLSDNAVRRERRVEEQLGEVEDTPAVHQEVIIGQLGTLPAGDPPAPSSPWVIEVDTKPSHPAGWIGGSDG